MPELPEVETVKRGLEKVMLNQTIKVVRLYRSDLRFPFPENFTSRLQNRSIIKLARRAKFLLIHLDNNLTLISHLGMSGRYIIDPQGSLQKHDHVEIQLFDRLLRYNDPRRFGYMDLITTDKLEGSKHFRHLGVEPLADNFNAETLLNKIHKRLSPIKTTIMDQRIVVGVGNIYACEALFKSRIHPKRACNTISRQELEILCEQIKQVLRKAIEVGGSSLKDHKQPDGKLGYFQHQLLIYGRENQNCKTCNTKIKRIIQANRSTFFCPDCQI